MNGAQDLGGQMGHGPVDPDPGQPLFHAPWERRALALTLAVNATGMWTIDTSRHTRESLPPATYLSIGYYEIWLRALVKLIMAHGLATGEEIASGTSRAPGKPVKRVLMAQDVAAVMAAGSPYDRPVDRPAAFRIGDRVRCRNDHVTTHTRMPRYVRGITGEIVALHGGFVFPDANAHGGGESPDWCYAVRFRSQDIWGRGADPMSEVMVDLWEPYLEPA